MKEYSVEDINRIVRPQLGEDIPLLLYRVLRIIGMRKLLGETAGATLYMMGKQTGTMIGANDLDDFKKKITELKIGVPEITVHSEESLTIKLYECITCAGFQNTGEMFCDMESGIIAGMLETVFKKKVKSTQTKSWSAGFSYCEFDIMLF